jgi:N-acetylneuraminic acid mutarotase
MNEGRGQVLVDATGDGHDMQLGDSPNADAADPTWALKWETLANLPVAVRASAAETDASHAFVFAGAQNVNDEVNHTQIYDVATNSWSLGTARDPVKAFNMAAALSDGIHVVGGFNTAHLNNHDVYDAGADSWSTRAAMPIAIHAGTAQAMGNKLYVMTGGRFSAVSLNQIYDAASNTWSMGAPRPVEGGTFASAVIDGLIYVTGGQAAGGTVTHDELHSYDPGTDSWQQLASLPGERSALGGGSIGGQFCVFGGRTANPSPTGARFSETFCYDPTTDSWTRGPDMITPRAEMASAELGHTIYALGGRPMNDALHSTFAERLVPDTPFP